MSSLGAAIRYWRQRGWLACLLVGTLSASMTASLAIYAALDGVWLQAVPYARSSSIVSLSRFNESLGHSTVSWRDFAAWRRQSSVFESTAAFHSGTAFLKYGTREERVRVVWASASMFPMLGEHPRVGRLPAEGEPAVALLTTAGTRGVLSGAEIGTAISVNGRAYTIVGVLPARFDELTHGDIVLPIEDKSGGVLRVLARLAPGMSESSATAAMEAGLEEERLKYPDAYRGWRSRIVPVRDQLLGADVGKLLWLLAALVAVLQLSAAASVSVVLMLAAEKERRCTAIRLILGASFWRVFRDQLSRAAVITSIAAVTSVILISWARDVAVSAIPPSVPRLSSIDVDAGVCIAAVVVGAITAALAAYGPIVTASRTSPMQVLQSTSPLGHRERLLTVAVIGQSSLACILLVAAVAGVHSFLNLVNTPVGFASNHLVSFLVTASGAGPFDWRKHQAVTRPLLDELTRSSEVSEFGGIDMPPFSGMRAMYSFRTPDVEGPASADEVMIEYRLITPGYFSTLKIPLLAGRDLTPDDLPGTEPVALVNQAAANRFWPGASPVGRTVFVSSSFEPITVIGVVGNVRQFGFDQEPVPELYRAWLQDPRGALHIMARPTGDPGELLRRLNQADVPFGKGATFSKVRMLDDYLARSVAKERFRTQLLLTFGLLAASLSIVGVMTVTAAQVQRSRRDIAIKLALGASRGAIVRRFVISRGIMPSLVGSVVGLGLLLGAGPSLHGLLNDAQGLQARPMIAGAMALVCSAAVTALCVSAAYTARIPASLLRRE